MPYRIASILLLSLSVLGVGNCDNDLSPVERIDDKPVNGFGKEPVCPGNYPAIFDDFKYATGNFESGPVGSHVAGSIFRPNHWTACDDQTEYHRGWYRTNSNDPPSRALSSIYVTSDNKLHLNLHSGYTYEGTGWQHNPAIEGFWRARYGTFAARVKFDDLEDFSEVNQAFYTFYRDVEDAQGSEMDFEWTNDVAIANYVTELTNSTHGVFEGGDAQEGSHAQKCNHYVGGSWVAQNEQCGISTSHGFANRWVTLLMVSSATSVKYYSQADGYDANGDPGWGTIYGKQGGGASGPITHENNLPFKAMYPVFGNGIHSSEERSLSQFHQLAIDWIYYSPIELTVSQVQAEVASLRIGEEQIHRMNTTGISFSGH